MKPKRLALAVLTVVAAGLTAAGCSNPFAPKDAPRDSAGAVTASAEADVSQLKVGDCTGPLAEGDMTESTVIPCADPHYYEAYASMDLSGDEYPEDVADQSETFCLAEFEGFVGVAFDQSVYEVFWLYPTPESWKLADRAVTCLTGSDAGGVTGTLEGSAQ